MTGSPSPRWRDRPTGDILVIIISATVCIGISGVGLATIVFLFLNPTADITAPARFVSDAVQTLIGLLAGFLAGTTTVLTRRRPEDHEDDTNLGEP